MESVTSVVGNIKIVINPTYGGFSLSDLAKSRLAELGQELDEYGGYYYIDRSSPFLVQVVEELGTRAHRSGDELRIVEIPADVTDWYIVEYDGKEHIAEGRTWD